MSSLQRAVNKANKKSQQALFPTSKGQFENSFATGLDLSELGDSSFRGEVPQESAAAQLLKVKAKEARQEAQNEADESRLRGVVQAQADYIDATIKRGREGNVLVNALVQMHGNDTKDPSVFRKTKKLSKKMISGRKAKSFTSKAVVGKAHKKRRFSKH